MNTSIGPILAAVCLGLLPLSGTADTGGIGNALVGPLFYTPAERDAIDGGNIVIDAGSPATGGQPPPAILRFNGRVERSGGRTSAWVSGQAIERVQSDTSNARLSLQGERLRIDTPETTRWLKAGEQFEPEAPPPK